MIYHVACRAKQIFSSFGPCTKYIVHVFRIIRLGAVVLLNLYVMEMSLDRKLLQKRHGDLPEVFRSQLVLSRHMTVVPVRHQSQSEFKVSDLASHSQRSYSVGCAEQPLYFGRRTAAFQVIL